MVNPQRASWWTALINQSLTSYLSKLALKKDEKGRFFFRPNKDGSDRIGKIKQIDHVRSLPKRQTRSMRVSFGFITQPESNSDV